MASTSDFIQRKRERVWYAGDLCSDCDLCLSCCDGECACLDDLDVFTKPARDPEVKDELVEPDDVDIDLKD